jgi:hypothetical protein
MIENRKEKPMTKYHRFFGVVAFVAVAAFVALFAEVNATVQG